MGPNLDATLDSIIGSNAETPQLLLRTWLDDLYLKSPELGLSSHQLVKMINFISHCTTLSMTTRLYIVDNCLWPNEYLSRDVINAVINQLGTATAIADFKIQTDRKIQLALCRWLVHVHFLFDPSDDLRDYHSNSSIWLHLWQYDFLQHWLTYIVVWSTTSVQDVKRWKVILLERVGSKPNYQDSRACATLVLLRFQSIVGESNLIKTAIDRLKCNARRLNTLQALEYQEKDTARLRSLLLKKSPSKFTDKIFDELISSSLDLLKSSKNTNKKTSFLSDAKSGDELLYNAQSLHKIAWHWDKIIVPKNVEVFLTQTAQHSYHFYLLALPKEHTFWSIAYRWVYMTLQRAFRLEEAQGSDSNANVLVEDVIDTCRVHDSFISPLSKDFFTLKNLKRGPNVFLQIFTAVLPLQMSFEGSTSGFEANLLEILAFSFLDGKKSRLILPRVVKPIILMMGNLLRTDDPVMSHLALKILQDIQDLLLSRSDNLIESRFESIELITVLDLIPAVNPASSSDRDLPFLISPRRLVQRLILTDDPMLLNACCNYLIRIKKYLLNKEPTNRYVQRQNDYILDLTNYLWRNKVLDARRFLNIPTEFLRIVVDNTYLPNAQSKSKTLLNITGIPALSYASIVKLHELERANHAQVHYRELINNVGFKNFRGLHSHTQTWLINNVSNLHDLKVEILKAFLSTGPYEHVAGFLITYLKSLSGYFQNGSL